MDNKQAAAVLRQAAMDVYCDSQAYERGADALEMLEWLLEYTTGKEFMTLRVLQCYSQWDGCDSFRAFCEARFEESNNA